jgi:hypothetical protein
MKRKQQQPHSVVRKQPRLSVVTKQKRLSVGRKQKKLQQRHGQIICWEYEALAMCVMIARAR